LADRVGPALACGNPAPVRMKVFQVDGISLNLCRRLFRVGKEVGAVADLCEAGDVGAKGPVHRRAQPLPAARDGDISKKKKGSQKL
jgi:hypothetical protein